LADDILRAVKRGGYGLYTSNGKIIVDKIYRYEDISQALEDLARRLNLPEVPVLPHMKSGFRKDRRPWHEALNADSIQRIREYFAWELENLYPELLFQLERN